MRRIGDAEKTETCNNLGFESMQKHVIKFIDESKAVLQSICSSNNSGMFVMLYPYSIHVSDLQCEKKSRDIGRSRSGSASYKCISRVSDLILLKLIDDVSLMNSRGQSDVDNAILLGRAMCSRLDECIQYLDRLRLRILDKTSKILVTGDVNSGKSTFVNAMVRRCILPMDQQPCTQSFCEVVPPALRLIKNEAHVDQRFFSSNYVHAIKDFEMYRECDDRTFEIMNMEEMYERVQDEDNYYQLFRIFLEDPQLLPLCDKKTDNIQISVIDSPGLNSDLFKTMSLYSKQEDIDVVVFLVNAANHLTLSAREFLETAGREKAYIFVIVNKFDEICNKEKCRRLVMGQIKEVLPKTFDEKSEMVHFISSYKFLKKIKEKYEIKIAGEYTDSTSLSPLSVKFSNIDPRDSSCKINMCDDDINDFLRVESCLHEFILEKRTRSKLEPAQRYVANLLEEVVFVLKYNQFKYQSDLEAIKNELGIVSPCYEELQAHDGLLQDEMSRSVELTAQELKISSVEIMRNFDTSVLIQKVQWNGVFKFVDNVHKMVVEAATECFNGMRQKGMIRILTGYQRLNSISSKHAPQIFNSFNNNYTNTSQCNNNQFGEIHRKSDFSFLGSLNDIDEKMAKTASDNMAVFDPERMAYQAVAIVVQPVIPVVKFTPFKVFEMVYKSAFNRLKNSWLTIISAAGSAAWAFGYQPSFFASILIRMISVPLIGFEGYPGNRHTSLRNLGFGLLVLGSGVLMWTTTFLIGEVESLIREHVEDHYRLFFTSKIWINDPAIVLETNSRQILCRECGMLVRRFEAALHEQRQLVAEKKLINCQLESTVGYIDSRLMSIREILNMYTVTRGT